MSVGRRCDVVNGFGQRFRQIGGLSSIHLQFEKPEDNGSTCSTIASSFQMPHTKGNGSNLRQFEINVFHLQDNQFFMFHLS